MKNVKECIEFINETIVSNYSSSYGKFKISHNFLNESGYPNDVIKETIDNYTRSVHWEVKNVNEIYVFTSIKNNLTECNTSNKSNFKNLNSI